MSKMARSLLIAPFSFLLWVHPAQSTPSVDGSNAKDEKSAIVSIQCPDSISSGFFVDERYLVVTKHGVEGCEVPSVSFHDGRSSLARTLYRSANQDIAILLTEEVAPAILSLGTSKDVIGKVRVISPTRAYDEKSFRIDEDDDLRDERRTFRIVDAQFRPGESGTPILEANDGDVIGMIVARLDSGEEGVIVRAETIDIVLDQLFTAEGEGDADLLPADYREVTLPLLVVMLILLVYGTVITRLYIAARKKAVPKRPRIRITAD